MFADEPKCGGAPASGRLKRTVFRLFAGLSRLLLTTASASPASAMAAAPAASSNAAAGCPPVCASTAVSAADTGSVAGGMPDVRRSDERRPSGDARDGERAGVGAGGTPEEHAAWDLLDSGVLRRAARRAERGVGALWASAPGLLEPSGAGEAPLPRKSQ